MSVTRQDIVNVAYEEWATWGYSRFNRITGERQIAHVDDEDLWADYVIEQYCAEMGKEAPSRRNIAEDKWAWSAVGITALMRKAGFNHQQWPFIVAHHTYLRRFIRAGKQQQPDLFWGVPVDAPGGQPKAGDLIAYARFDEGDLSSVEQKWKTARSRFDLNDRYNSHADIVVAVRPGEVDVIGANVEDSVTLKTLELSPDGYLSDRHYYWFVTLKFRD